MSFAHNMTTRTKTTADGWSSDLFIPWAIFTTEFRPTNGRVHPLWRLNFYRYDYPDGKDKPFELSAWSPTHDASFHVPSRFGRASA